MSAIPWPNGLGWDVGADAEVWKGESGLSVRIFTEDGQIKSLFISDPYFDPVLAVRRCHEEGKVLEE